MTLAAPIEYTDAAQMLADYTERRKRFFPVSIAIKPEPAALAPKPAPERDLSRNGMLWTKEEDARLRELAAAGAGASTAARLMGRTVGGIVDYAGKHRIRFTREILRELRSIAKEAVNCRLVFERIPSNVRTFEQGRYILGQVASDLNIPVSEIVGIGRQETVIRARQQAMWLIARDTLLSMPAIGRIFHRDHTTVLNAIRRENARRGENVRSVGGLPRK